MECQRTIDSISEVDVIKDHLSLDWRQRGATRIKRRLRRGIQNVPEPGNRYPRLMKILPELRQPQHGLRHTSREHVEGDEFADAELALDDEVRAEVKRQRGHDFAD